MSAFRIFVMVMIAFTWLFVLGTTVFKVFRFVRKGKGRSIPANWNFQQDIATAERLWNESLRRSEPHQDPTMNTSCETIPETHLFQETTGREVNLTGAAS
jgi:hypothetical protein